MHLNSDDRCAVFVDGANNHAAVRDLGIAVDYARLRRLFAQRTRLMRTFYYTAVPSDQEYAPIRPLLDWLDYNNWSVVTKPTKEQTDIQGHRRTKGDMDVDIAIDVMELAPRLEQVVLFSGDGDFTRLIEHVQRRGVHAIVVSTLRSPQPMIADELRRRADEFIELEDLRPEIERK